MTSAKGIEPKRSEEYSNLFEELKQAFVSAANVAVKLYKQGKKDGLSNEAASHLLHLSIFLLRGKAFSKV